MGVSKRTEPFSLLSLIVFSFIMPWNAGAHGYPRKLLVPIPFIYDFKVPGSIFGDGKWVSANASPSPPPSPPSAPPPSISEEKPVYSPFRPSIAVLVGVLTTTFSITFLLLLYVKHCKRGNVVVIGYARHPNSMGAPTSTTRKNSGIDQAIIESLPIFRFGSLRGQKEGLECAVCLNRFETTEVLRLLPKCKHAFHVECVDTWLDAHSTCPLCRYRVDPEDVLLVEDVNILVDSQPIPNPISPPGSQPRDSNSKYVVLNLETGRRSGMESCKPGSRRVSGRHSSVGEKRTGGFWQNFLEKTGESSSRDSASFRRSLDSAGSRKKSETVAVGCFDRPRKDGLLLPEDKTNQERDRFEHRILVSPSTHQRWSDVQPSDLLYLRSEMILSDSRRFSAAALPSELKRQRWMGMAKSGKGHGMAEA